MRGEGPKLGEITPVVVVGLLLDVLLLEVLELLGLKTPTASGDFGLTGRLGVVCDSILVVVVE